MKILQVVHSFPPFNMAGTEVYTYNLSRELAKRHKVFVFHRVNDRRRKEYELRNSHLDGLSIYTINNTFRRCDSFEMTYRNKAIDDAFGRVLDHVNPDVVHIQHLLFLSTALIDEIKKRNIPVIFTLNDYWLICQQGQFLKRGSGVCKNHVYSECANCLLYLLSIKKGVMGAYQFLREIMPNFLLQFIKKSYFYYAKATYLSQNEAINQIESRIRHIKQICEKVDLFIAPSEFLKNKFLAYGLPPGKIISSRYGLNKKPFTGFKKIKAEKLRLGYIGTLLPAKGAHILIKAFNKIRNHNAELRIYGSPVSYKGFEYYPRYIRRLARNKNIRFMGGFDHKDISKVFSEIDVLIFPSIWEENCPLTILEGLSTGTPVIASEIGGIPELIIDNVNGMLFKAGDTDELKEKIQYVIDSPEIIIKLKDGMPEVKAIEDNAREMEELYI